MQQAWKLDKETLGKIGRGAILAGGGAVLTFLASNTDLVAALFADHPMAASVATALISVALNAVKEWSKGSEGA
jgi:hypothetical protein